MNSKGECCESCSMGDEGCVFPLYGLAPHDHNTAKTGGTFIGSTELHGRESWPENFSEDPEADGCGVYEYCIKCKAADPDWDK